MESPGLMTENRRILRAYPEATIVESLDELANVTGPCWIVVNDSFFMGLLELPEGPDYQAVFICDSLTAPYLKEAVDVCVTSLVNLAQSGLPVYIFATQSYLEECGIYEYFQDAFLKLDEMAQDPKSVVSKIEDDQTVYLVTDEESSMAGYIYIFTYDTNPAKTLRTVIDSYLLEQFANYKPNSK